MSHLSSTDYLAVWNQLSTCEKKVALGAFSAFLPFWLTIPILLWIVISEWIRLGSSKAFFHSYGIIFALLFCAMSILSSLAWQNWLGLANALGMVVIFLFVFYAMKWLTGALLEWIIRGWIYLSIPVGAIGILQYIWISFQTGTFVMHDDPLYRISSVFYHPNLYGTILVFLILFCLYSYIRFKNKYTRYFLFCAGLFNFFMLLLTGCRSALVPLFIAFPILFYGSRHRKLFWIAIFIDLIILALVLTFPGIIPRLDDVGTVMSRILIWNATIEYLPQFLWFGGGPQAFHLIAGPTGLYTSHAHNMILDSLLSYGVTGFFLMGGFLLSQLKSLFKLLQTHRNLLFCTLVITMCFVSLLQGVIDVTLNYSATSLLFLLILTWPCAFLTKLQEQQDPNPNAISQ